MLNLSDVLCHRGIYSKFGMVPCKICSGNEVVRKPVLLRIDIHQLSGYFTKTGDFPTISIIGCDR